jgi:hypothetical protein
MHAGSSHGYRRQIKRLEQIAILSAILHQVHPLNPKIACLYSRALPASGE